MIEISKSLINIIISDSFFENCYSNNNNLLSYKSLIGNANVYLINLSI